jgi:AcrR family transcriptional regulator
VHAFTWYPRGNFCLVSASSSGETARRRAARVGRPPGSSAEQTTARLLAAARVQFGDRGYGGARMTEIADAAGVVHSAIYQYFQSKRALYRAVFDAALAELMPEYLAAIEGAECFRDQIAAVFRASVRVHQRHPGITPFLASVPLEVRRHPELLDTLARDGQALVSAMHDMFERARRRGEIPPDTDDYEMLVAFVGAAMGVGLLSYGMAAAQMGPAVEILLSAFDGRFFRVPEG